MAKAGLLVILQCIVVCVVLVAVIASQTGQVLGATVLADSNFQINADGWLVTGKNKFDSGTPQYDSTGFIWSGDHCPDPDQNGLFETDLWAWNAPSKFLQNMRAAYGGTLQMQVRAGSSFTSSYATQPTLTLLFLTAANAKFTSTIWFQSSQLATLTSWSLVSITIYEGFFNDSSTGTNPSSQQFQDALSTLSSVTIVEDFMRTPSNFGAGNLALCAYDDGHLDGVQLLSADIVPASCAVTGSGLLGGVAGSTLNATVTVRGSYNVNITLCNTTQFDMQFVNSSGSRQTFASICSANADVNLSFSSTQAGNHSLIIMYQGVHLPGSPFVIPMAVGPASPSATTTNVTTFTGVAGVTSVMLLQERDQYGNACAITALSMAAYMYAYPNGTRSDAQIAGTTSAVSAGPAGVHFANFSATASGVYYVDIASTIPLPGFPMAFNVSGGAYNWTTTVVGGMTALWPPYPVVTAGQQIYFNVSLRDKYRNPIPVVPLSDFLFQSLAWAPPPPPATSAVVFDPHDVFYNINAATATYYGNWSMTSARTYNRIQLLPFQPYFAVRIVAGPTYPATCQVTGFADGSVGQQQNFTIQAYDAYSNIRTTGPDAFWVQFTPTLVMRGVLYVYGNVSYIASGKTLVNYTTEWSGQHVLWITINGSDTGARIQYLTMLPGLPNPNNFLATGSGLTEAATGLTATLTISGRDGYGNPTTLSAGDMTGNITNGTITSALVFSTQSSTEVVAAYVPTFIGIGHLTTNWLGVMVPAATGNVVIIPGVPYAPLCHIVPPLSAVAGTQVNWAVQANDEFNNPILNASAFFSALLLPSSNVSFSLYNDAYGTVQLSFFTTVSGEYAAHMIVSGTNITGSPYSFAVLPGAVSANTCSGEGAGLDSAVAGELAPVFLYVQDVFSNWYGGPELFDASIRDQNGLPTAYPNVAATGVVGMYTANYMLQIAGKFQLNVTWLQVPLSTPGFPREITVHPGPLDVQQCSVDGAGLSNGVAGQPNPTSITARDSFGNVRISMDSFNAQLSVAALDMFVSDLYNGTYLILYTVQQSGELKLQVFTSSQQVSREYLVHIAAGSIAPENCILVGAALTASIANGTDFCFSIYARDAYNNTVSTTEDDLFDMYVRYQPTGINCAGRVVITDSSLGLFTACYAVQVAGFYSIYAAWNSTSLASTPQYMLARPGATEPLNSQAEGQGLNSTVAGQVAVIQVQTKDANNNRRDVGGDVMEIFMSPDNLVSVHVTDYANGTYLVTYVVDTAGQYTARIAVNAVLISSTVYAVTVVPDVAAPAVCTADGEGIKVGTPGFWNSIAVAVTDKFGNQRYQGNDVVVHHVTGAAGVELQTFAHAGGGIYSGAWLAQLSGVYVVVLTVNGDAIASSPFTATLMSGAVKASSCVATFDHGLEVVAGQSHTVLMQARDAYGNNVTMSGLTFTVAITTHDTNAVMSRIIATDGGNGQYYAMYNLTVSGTFVIYVTFQQVSIENSPRTVWVSPGDIVAALTSTSGMLASTLLAQSSTGITISPRDNFGNLNSTCNPGILVTFAIVSTVPYSTPSCDPVLGFNLSTVHAGPQTLQISFAGMPVAGSPWAFTVLAGPISVVNSAFYLSANVLVAGAMEMLVVHPKDVFGNVCDQTGYDFQVITSTAKSVSTSHILMQDGRYSISYVMNITGGYLFSVFYGVEALPTLDGSVVVAPGSVAATMTTVDFPRIVPVGVEGFMVIQPADMYGNSITAAALSPSELSNFVGELVSASSALVVQFGVVNGAVAGGFTSFSAGVYTAKAEYSNVTMPYAGGTVANSVVFTAGSIDPSMCKVLLPSSVLVGEPHNVTIQPADHYDNAQVAGAHTFWVVSTSQTFCCGKVQGYATAVSKYLLSYVANFTVADSYSYAIYLSGLPVANSPYQLQVLPGPIYAAACEAYFPYGMQITVGSNASYSVQPRDIYGNAVRQEASNNQTFNQLLNDRLDDLTLDKAVWLYVGSFIVTTSGTHSLAVKYNHAHIKASPFTITAYPGSVSASQSYLRLCTNTTITAGQNTSATITSRDEFGNGRQGAGFIATLTISTTVVTLPLLSSNSGQYAMSVNITAAGQYLLHAYYIGTDIGNSPAGVMVQAGAAWLPYTQLSGPSLLLTAVGLSVIEETGPTQIVVTTFDAYGNQRTQAGDMLVARFAQTCSRNMLGESGLTVANADGTFMVAMNGTAPSGFYYLQLFYGVGLSHVFNPPACLLWLVLADSLGRELSATPTMGPIEGHTYVLLQGFALVLPAGLGVAQFGSARSDVVTNQDATISCFSPKYERVSRVSLEIVILDRVTLIAPSGFFYYESPQLQAVTPAWVSTAGEWLLITGTGLLATSDTKCLFSSNVLEEVLIQDAEAIGSDAAMVSCKSPPWNQTVQLLVCVALNGQQCSNALPVSVYDQLPPQAVDDVATTTEGKAVLVDVLLNDYTAMGLLEIDGITQLPRHGSVELNDSKICYVPNDQFSGNDTFTYRAVDNLGRNGIATVYVTVVPKPPSLVNLTSVRIYEDASFTLLSLAAKYSNLENILEARINVSSGLLTWGGPAGSQVVTNVEASCAASSAQYLPLATAAGKEVSICGNISEMNRMLNSLGYSGPSNRFGLVPLDARIADSLHQGPLFSMWFWVEPINDAPYFIVNGLKSVQYSAVDGRLPEIAISDDSSGSGLPSRVRLTITVYNGSLELNITQVAVESANSYNSMTEVVIVRTIQIEGTTAAANHMLSSMSYEYNSESGDLPRDVVVLVATDEGNNQVGASMPLYAELHVDVPPKARGDYTSTSLDKLQQTDRQHALIGTIGITSVFGVIGAVLLLASLFASWRVARRLQKHLRTRAQEEQQAYEKSRVFNPIWIPSTPAGDAVMTPNPLLLRQRVHEYRRLRYLQQEFKNPQSSL